MEYPLGIHDLEKPAYKYLCSLNLGQIEYEKLGPNSTPDFSVGKILAVETTAIMQTVNNGISQVKIEQNYPSLYKSISNLLCEFNPLYQGHTFFVGFQYSANLEKINRSMKKEIKEKVRAFLSKPYIENDTFNIGEEIEFSVFITTPDEGIVFKLAYCSCDEQLSDSSKYIYAPEVLKAIEIKNKQAKKSEKIFNEWWLILVDLVYFGLTDKDKLIITGGSIDTGLFSKTFIINLDAELLALIEHP